MTFFFQGWQWAAKSLLLLGLVVAAGWLGQRTQHLRATNAELNDSLAQLPETLSAEAVRRMELAEQQPTLERLQRFLPRREEVGVVAGALEREGTQRQVALVITDVREAEVRDASGAVVPASGPLRDIWVAGVATGRPTQLLHWLAAVERLPYLMQLQEWKFRVLEPITVTVPPQMHAELTFAFLLSIRYGD